MARISNPSVTRKSSAAKKLAIFAADVSDQREMDQGYMYLIVLKAHII